MLSEEILKQLGKQIKSIRIQKGLRQKVVAKRCGFYATGYSSIETGARNVSILTLYQIALALEEPMSSFFDDETFYELLENTVQQISTNENSNTLKMIFKR